MLNKENITNILVVIVRYFGGILLGAGPLARAYLNCFKGAYLSLEKEEKINYKKLDIKITYDNMKNFDHALCKYIDNKDVIIKEKKFGQVVDIYLEISIEKYNEIYKNIKLLLED